MALRASIGNNLARSAIPEFLSVPYVLFWLFDCFVAITVRYVSVAYRPDAITLSDVLPPKRKFATRTALI
jgi:hypothetical protein